ncbi:MAG TPA: ATP-binding protein, partial [Chitinophagaceae bacterium]|nr:ATP-binding protein [Chitinophagaceae bacterium]
FYIQDNKLLQLAYARFVDIQQAEEQAREAQIEAALERVRSRSMAMHKSDELKDVIRVVLEQFIVLNIKAEHAGFYIDYKAHDDMHIWLADPNLEPFFAVIPYFDTPTWNSFLEAKTKGVPLHTDLLDFKTKNKFYTSLFKLFKVPEEAKQFYLKCKGLAVSTVLLDNVGLYIENFSAIPYTDQENEILMRFGNVFQQTYTRFLDLQKAEAQAREAQIEVALERVRSRSMAMHKSVELADLSLELVKQVQALGVATWFCAFNIKDDELQGSLEWGSNGQGTFPTYRTPREGVFLRYYEAGQKGETLLINEIGEAECPAHYEYLCTLPGLGEQLLGMKNAGIAFPVSQIDHVAFFKYGYIIFITYKAVPESHDIFVRFAKIFEQTYTRFLDLKKAEAQAREAQIEAAVERVRAQSMAMHKASDLVRVNEELLLQLSRLNITGLTGVSFYLVDEAGMVKVWDLSSPGNVSGANNYAFSYDPEKFPILGEFVGIWKAAEQDYFILDFPLEKLLLALEELQQIAPDVAVHFRNAIASGALTHQWNPAGRLTNGMLSIDMMQAPSEDTKNIVLKMAGAFNLAYQRFLDLQKAEAQTKEAQIEAALEKVRSRTMAMQSSNELQETAAVLFQEFKKLGTDHMYQVTIGIYNEAAQLIDFRVTSWADNGAQENRSFQLDMNEPTLLFPAVTAWRANKKSVVIDLTGEALEGWLNYRNRMSGITVRSQDTEGRRVISVAFFSKGHISISSPVPVSDETLRTLERFAAVFDGTYTRFLDLEKAEAQAREAQIAAALERVRSRTLAMQRSEELVETAAVLFQQLNALGIEPNRLYISIINSEQGETEFWITDEEGRKVSTAFTAKMQDNATFLKMFEGWRQQQKSLVIDMQGEELQNYFRHLTGLGVSFKGGLEQKRRIQEIAYFSKGFIGMASPEEQPAETLELLERFAAVFNLTFTRFNDLKMAEAHARQSELDLIAIKEAKLKAEEALSVLQATQKQLVQAEKMASLGELTAGIAHEIQNPLNFVNNFSEVSNELISEMVDEVDKGNTEEVKAIARDVQQNLEKILHHGKRADGIVKGMLQHSRSSSGVKEPTDINALADEYLRLAYHGLRAKDKSFNASLKTEFDDTIGNIPVIPQDIGRVILNLITNAFYAAPLPPKGGFSDPDYRHVPTVWVSTKRERDKVIISVRDNGPGIPEEIRDKIFQPFFTTKPTGQGTGLGLSLSYDIVKAHGGELKVNTTEGGGAEFIIQLNMA